MTETWDRKPDLIEARDQEQSLKYACQVAHRQYSKIWRVWAKSGGGGRTLLELAVDPEPVFDPDSLAVIAVTHVELDEYDAAHADDAGMVRRRQHVRRG